MSAFDDDTSPILIAVIAIALMAVIGVFFEGLAEVRRAGHPPVTQPATQTEAR